MQDDFSPPVSAMPCQRMVASDAGQNGSLAVQGTRDLAPGINRLLHLPGFAVKVSTGDWHPADHASFAHVHEPPNNRPFTDQADMRNPSDPSETKRSTLWPSHCVQDTPGAAIIAEIDAFKAHRMLRKGMDQRVEMYSAFRDIFGNRSGASFDLAEYLRAENVSHVYVVGVTGDCCVFHTARDAAREGFQTVVLEDLTRSISETDFTAAKSQMRQAGIVGQPSGLNAEPR